jgi:tetratricopeptide (TPR) repeat protein
MRSGRRLRAWALVVCIGAAAAGVVAPRPAWAEATSPANEAAARRHFERARDYYAQGSYRDAIGELEAAHALDPNAKDLIFNLAVVHEKLGQMEDALTWSRLYATMDLTSAEREKAEAYVHRLEGAKKELEDQPPTPDMSGAAAAPISPLPPPPPPPAKPPSGNGVNALVVGLGSLSITALAFGVVLAVKAEEDRPPSLFVTGRDGTYLDLASRQANAHREAVMADIGFGVAATAAAATVVLLVARLRGRTSARTPTRFSAVPLLGGCGVVVQGAF